LTKKELFKEIKSTAIIVSVIVGLFFLNFLFNNKSFQNIFFISLVAYISLIVFLFLLGLFLKNKYFDKFTTIISFPIGIIYAVLSVIIPFMVLPIHVIFYFGISFLIPEIIHKTLGYFHLIDFIKTPTIQYLKITLTVFISVLLNPLLRHIIYYISPVRMKTSEKLKPYEFDKLTDYFLSTDNIRFFVYGFYVIALLITNFFNFQGSSITENSETDKSILQSFVTFIAFDRAFILMKQLDFKPSMLLSKIYQSISNKLKTEIEDEKSTPNSTS